jgi:dienelactone hydrolase
MSFAPLHDVFNFQLEMAAARSDCQIIIYSNTYHSFTDPECNNAWPGIAYNATSAARCWDATIRFLEERLR